MKRYYIPTVKLIYVADSIADNTKVITSNDVITLLRDSYDEGEIGYQEYFKVAYLSRANKLLGIHTISFGGTANTIVDPKVVFTGALLANAASIILAHNHPSGTLRPSVNDDNITKKLSKAAKLLDINVLDHIILTDEGHYSYADNGRL